MQPTYFGGKELAFKIRLKTLTIKLEDRLKTIQLPETKNPNPAAHQRVPLTAGNALASPMATVTHLLSQQSNQSLYFNPAPCSHIAPKQMPGQDKNLVHPEAH